MVDTDAVQFECEMVSFLINNYFDGDVGNFAKHTRYSKQQVMAWVSGRRKPRIATMRWLLSSTIAPEFRIAAEYVPVVFSNVSDIRSELRRALGDHSKHAGVYAFYDSMCNVLYIGKASTEFLGEMYQQLRAKLGISFPKAISKAPEVRWQAVSFVSAYEIPYVEHLDYPRHVESLVLRLSKPTGNKVLGKLQQSIPPKEPS